jgi:hypothetical protein
LTSINFTEARNWAIGIEAGIDAGGSKLDNCSPKISSGSFLRIDFDFIQHRAPVFLLPAFGLFIA